MNPDIDLHARIPADVDAPDKIMLGLTARQVAILAAALALAYALWQVIGDTVPLPVLGIVLVPLAGVAVAVALGRRDGLSLEVWLRAALAYRRAPRRAVPGGTHPAPEWAPPVGASSGPVAPLRLPAHAINTDGTIDTGPGAVALVAAGTVNIDLRTGDEQAALVAGYARWLNALSAPVQIVVSTRRADLAAHATRIIDTAQTLSDPALADAALDYAEFLLDLAEQRDPLSRTVTIATTASGESAATEVRRAAEHTAATLATLGVSTVVLDGPAATAALAAATDPYQAGDATWPRTPPGTPVKAHAEGSN